MNSLFLEREIRGSSDSWRKWRRLRASSLDLVTSSTVSSNRYDALSFLLVLGFMTSDAKKWTPPADSMHLLLVSLAEAMDLRLFRHCTCVCGDDVAIFRRFVIWDFVTGGFGVGTLSTPCGALRMHQDWIRRRRVWFGVIISGSEMACLVTGHVLFFSENIHFSMLSRS